MRESRLSGSVEGVMGNHDSYSDWEETMIPKRRRIISAWALSGGIPAFKKLRYLTSARIRTGAADPPVSFMGATMATAWLAGMRSRLATLVRT